MWFTSRSHNRQSAISGERRRADGFRWHRLAFHPRSELLEGRALPSTLWVTNTRDNGNKANGTVLGEGGGIYSDNSVLTLVASTVKGNKASTAYDDIFVGP
jgi:hypothetical protein